MRMWTIAAGFAALGMPSFAQDYDFTWLTVGDPGNPPATEDEFPLLGGLEVGAVDYEFRLTQTEVSVGQWFEYVNAYWPYQDENLGRINFTSTWILPRNRDPGPGEDPEYYITLKGAEAFPANMGWYHAARYVNWLHNGKVEEQWAFEDGVYDTSTFGGVDEFGNPTDQPRHHPDARFWIPTMDEWTKGMYWDPNRDGEGEGGYWLMPDSGNENLISAPPEKGGETNAGLDDYLSDPFEAYQLFFPSGQFPGTQSPWGLLDGSGGVKEWNEDRTPDKISDSRVWQGSWFELDQDFFFHEDRLDTISIKPPTSHTPGLRIASLPTSSTTVVLGVAAVFMCGSRRRTYR